MNSGYEGSPGFPEMFCSMIKKTLEDKDKRECSSRNGVGHVNPTIYDQSEASTFQTKQNGRQLVSKKVIMEFEF